MFTSLKNYFLIAMPALMDPHFFRSVTYLCEHSEQGAMGIIINQPLIHLRLKNVLEQIHLRTSYEEIANQRVFSGGPLQQDRGFILHNKGTHWKSTIDISDEVALTTSPDILKAMSHNEGPAQTFVALGYAHWEPGLLEKEMAENSWLYAPANIDILFHMSIEYRWRAALALMGVDVDRLSSDVGHA
jgi:putative transcriptional regulator